MSLRVLTQQYSVLLLVTLGAVVTAFVTHSIVFMLALALFGGLYLVAQQESIHSSRLLRRFTLSAVILFVSVGSFNYVINPLGLYPPRFFNPILSSSQTDKMRLLLAFPTKPSAVILGNSRTFSMDPVLVEKLWGYPAFNLSVADGTMRDSLALMRFTLDQRGSLRFIIINVDDLTFLDYNKAQNVQVNRSAFNDVGLYRYLDGDRWYAPLLNLWDQFVRLFTLQQVDASLRLLQVESEGRNQPVFVFDPDGQAQFYRSMSLDESTTQLLTHYRQVGYAGWFQPAHLDDNAFGYLQQLLQQCQRQGISVLGYLPPGHPRYQQYLETEGTGYLSYHNRVVSRLHDLEQIYPFHFMDFTYQSEKLYGDDLEPYFSDAIHPNEAGSVIIMQALYDAFPEGN